MMTRLGDLSTMTIRTSGVRAIAIIRDD